MICCVILNQVTLEKGVEDEQDWWLIDSFRHLSCFILETMLACSEATATRWRHLKRSEFSLWGRIGSTGYRQRGRQMTKMIAHIGVTHQHCKSICLSNFWRKRWDMILEHWILITACIPSFKLSVIGVLMWCFDWKTGYWYPNSPHYKTWGRLVTPKTT